ncbi:MAG: isoamylase early set domain-containing protein [Candidatus Omnitrophica bacterium]|nr:isoamylase early set domain-containing protein [Candidatus Omnitrophota bacterium]
MVLPTNTQSRPTTSVPQDVDVTFEYQAPKAKSVYVAGSFNKWSTIANSLTRDAQGVWKTSIRLRPGRYEYRFYVDGKWTDDPKAKERTPNGFGSQNAVLNVRS